MTYNVGLIHMYALTDNWALRTIGIVTDIFVYSRMLVITMDLKGALTFFYRKIQ